MNMAYSKEYTPLPPRRLAPLRVTVADVFGLPATDTRELLDHQTFSGQLLDVNRIGTQVADDVDVQLSTTETTARGETSQTETYAAGAVGAFDEPIDSAPVATERVRLTTRNRSQTDYTQAGSGLFKSYLDYTIRPLTVIEKVRRNIPLTGREEQLASRYNIPERERLNVPKEIGDVHKANFAEKVILDEGSTVETVDISTAGRRNATKILDVRPSPNEVIYLTGISVNGQDFTAGDSLQLAISRGDNRDVARVDTLGLPNAPYQAEFHLPTVDRLNIAAFAGAPVSDVEVRVETTRVERTLLEKALYGLDNQIKSNDAQASRRTAIYDEMQARIAAGVPVVRDDVAEIESTTTASTPRR